MNTPDLVGNCGYAEFDYPNLFLPDRLWIARFQNHSRMLGKFAWYLVSSDGVGQLTGILATGTSGSMKNLSQDAFLNITIALPPTNEQCAIADHLDRETARIDQLTAKVEAAIERLTEYRQALITSAVTGKIDVRSLSPTLSPRGEGVRMAAL
ncbi:MAG: Type I site-specific deoxyribonuclease [Candidatus Gallionella acididurans]|uniref:Type I site-specific deoxyribonuclease n=1 Tax=Candidatus Gallionella acididurans TaxID=1796491 RepID=A0A139BRL5_9PROT|nr:MAG: Type I site-specific deoxyribonuclease [Candidatus Gallionella acididurans]